MAINPLPAIFELTTGVVLAVVLQVVPAIGVVNSLCRIIVLLAVTAVVDALPVFPPVAIIKCPATALPNAAGEDEELPTLALA